MVVEIAGPEKAGLGNCERVLRALPNSFGIEEALVQYVKDIATKPTFHARLDGRLVGFRAITRNTGVSAEIHMMGVGSALVERAEQSLRQDGVVLYEVKTLGTVMGVFAIIVLAKDSAQETFAA